MFFQTMPDNASMGCKLIARYRAPKGARWQTVQIEPSQYQGGEMTQLVSVTAARQRTFSADFRAQCLPVPRCLQKRPPGSPPDVDFVSPT